MALQLECQHILCNFTGEAVGGGQGGPGGSKQLVEGTADEES